MTGSIVRIIARQVALAALLALGACASSGPAPLSEPVGTKPNEFVATYGKTLGVAEVTVAFPDSTIGGTFDSQTSDYIAKRLPTAERAALEAMAGGRASDPKQSGERFSEYVVAASLRSSVNAGTGERAVNVEVKVERTHLPDIAALATNLFASPYPSADITFRITDATSRQTLAQGSISNVVLYQQDPGAISKRIGLQQGGIQTNTEFRNMVNLAEYLANAVSRVLRSEQFMTGTSRGAAGSYSLPVVQVTIPAAGAT